MVPASTCRCGEIGVVLCSDVLQGSIYGAIKPLVMVNVSSCCSSRTFANATVYLNNNGLPTTKSPSKQVSSTILTRGVLHKFWFHDSSSEMLTSMVNEIHSTFEHLTGSHQNVVRTTLLKNSGVGLLCDPSVHNKWDGNKNCFIPKPGLVKRFRGWSVLHLLAQAALPTRCRSLPIDWDKV